MGGALSLLHRSLFIITEARTQQNNMNILARSLKKSIVNLTAYNTLES